MDAKHWGLTLLAVALSGAVLVLGDSWLGAHDDQVRLAAVLESQKSIIAAADQRERDRNQQLRQTLEQIEQLKHSVQTPQQVIKEIPRYLPPLPTPIQVNPAPQDPSRAAAPGPPTTGEAGPPRAGESGPPPDVRVPAEDLKPLFDFVQDCRACQAERETLKANLSDEQTKATALEKQRDAALKAARGGRFWQRVGRAAKWGAIGFAIGYVVHGSQRHSP